ncbi:transglycosylase SLT domain-containing protein [Cupriavidus sp. 2KB_15]
MHLRSFNDYERLGTKVKRPDYWPATAYRVTQKASDKQALPKKDKQGSPKPSTTTGATDPVVVGLGICSQPNPKSTVLGILPRGARITAVERSPDKKWVKISSVLQGKIASPSTAQTEPLAGVEQGWVQLGYLEAQGKAPEAFDSVVTPVSAIAIKAGALLGHLGEYRRIKDPAQDRVILHHEIIVGPELRSFLDKSRVAASAAKPQEKTLLRVAPGARLRNAALAESQAGLLAANTVVELDGTPHEDALYVKVKPIQTMQWIERKPVLPKGAKGTGDALPKGAADAKLFRHSNGTPYAAKDIVRPPKQGTAGKQGATLFRGILLAAASSEPVWMTKQAFNALYALEKGKLLVTDLAQGWSSFPLTFVDNGPANGPYPQRFGLAPLEQAKSDAPDPSQPPTVYAVDEAGKRWRQVQISDDTTIAIGWAGEAGHAGVSLHSPHEWVDFQLIESKPKGEGYGNIFTTLDQMTAFQGGELALNDAQLDEPMRKVFASLDTTPDHRLTLGELQAVQRSRGKLGELSRLIIRYPSEWKADPASWNAWDKNVPPSAQPAWQSEKARIAKLVWWDAIAGKVNGFPIDPFVFHIHPVAFVENFPKNSRCINYEVMYAPVGMQYRDEDVVTHSHYRLPIDKTPGRLSGNSRVHGDATKNVQRQVIDLIVEAATNNNLTREDLALVLAIARVESGFNPDAAAGTTSAAGLGQFVDATALHYGITTDSQRFDAETSADALVRHTLDNMKMARARYSGRNVFLMTYAYHHDGPSLQYGGREISEQEIMPRLDLYLDNICKSILE